MEVGWRLIVTVASNLWNCDDASLFQKWVIQWQDLVDFEIVPVIESKQAAEAVDPFL